MYKYQVLINFCIGLLGEVLKIGVSAKDKFWF